MMGKLLINQTLTLFAKPRRKQKNQKDKRRQIFGRQYNSLSKRMEYEWVECERTYSNGEKCRQCKSSATYCRNRLITACDCQMPIHEKCLMDEIITIQKQSPERLKWESGGEGFWVYSCTFCKGHILFYFDFSAKLIPCHNQAKKNLTCIIALMILIVILGFFVPCFLVSLLQQKLCWFSIGIVGLILIFLGYWLFDSMTTIFFRKKIISNPGTSKEIIVQNTEQLNDHS